MVEVLKRGKWVEAKTIPQTIGSVWRSDQYVHGPRVRQPDEFSKLYTFPIERARARHIELIKKPPKATKAKAGPLKSSGQLVVQSYLTPVRAHYRLGKHVRKHLRILSVKGSKAFKQIGTKITRDPEVSEMWPDVNLREVEYIHGEPGEDLAGGLLTKEKGTSLIGANILVSKGASNKGHTILHELGHLDDMLKRGFDIDDEEYADEFAARKSRELGFSAESASRLEKPKGGPSKWQRRIIAKEEKKGEQKETPITW